MFKRLLFIGSWLMVSEMAGAQQLTPEQYIETYKDIAIAEMKRKGVPASITLAQGLLETENGNSDLVKRSNNHFGIKCKSTWTGGTVYHDDDERGECFRKYDNAIESYIDHSDFLRNNSRYAFLFDLDPKDYVGWAKGLKKAGYATNPRYPQILINHIETHNLHRYTLEALGLVDSVAVQGSGSIYHYDAETAVPSLEKTQRFGLDAVYAPSGTSLLAIATRYNIALAKLLEYNDLEADGLLEADAWIFLEKKWKQAKQLSHTTTRAESVYTIAQLHALQLAYLLEFNKLEKDAIVPPGTTVWLQPVTAMAPGPGVESRKTHIVQPKEGLYGISQKYGVTVAELKAWNGLQENKLSIGQKLIVSK